MCVCEVMTKKPTCCTPSCTAQMAAAMMKQADTGFLPVLEKFTRRLVGVVTDRDLCLGVIAQGKDPAHTSVHEYMSKHLVCCDPEDDVRKPWNLMKAEFVRRVLVVDAAGNLEGVPAIGALVRYTEIAAENIRSVLARICAPSSVTGM